MKKIAILVLMLAVLMVSATAYTARYMPQGYITGHAVGAEFNPPEIGNSGPAPLPTPGFPETAVNVCPEACACVDHPSGSGYVILTCQLPTGCMQRGSIVDCSSAGGSKYMIPNQPRANPFQADSTSGGSNSGSSGSSGSSGRGMGSEMQQCVQQLMSECGLDRMKGMVNSVVAQNIPSFLQNCDAGCEECAKRAWERAGDSVRTIPPIKNQIEQCLGGSGVGRASAYDQARDRARDMRNQPASASNAPAGSGTEMKRCVEQLMNQCGLGGQFGLMRASLAQNIPSFLQNCDAGCEECARRAWEQAGDRVRTIPPVKQQIEQCLAPGNGGGSGSTPVDTPSYGGGSGNQRVQFG